MAITDFLKKQLERMVFGRSGQGYIRNGYGWAYPGTFGRSPRSAIDYAQELGDGTNSDIVMSCVHWLMTNIQEPPMMLYRLGDREQEEQPVERHPLLDLLDTPNPYYDGQLLLSATELSYVVDGNAYWALVRSGAGRVVEIWWVPHWLIEPRWPEDGEQFISHYDYKPGQTNLRLEPEDVIHFRFGLDPSNQRKGLSRLKTVMRELFSDAEAANYTAALLRNGAVPGLTI